MKMEEVLEVLDDVEFCYPEDRRYQYVIPAGLTLRQGESWCLYGVSGSGKTTLMTLLAALRRFQRGRIRYRFSHAPPFEVAPDSWGLTVGPALWRRVGFAFQRPELIRALTVGDNLSLVAGNGRQVGHGSLFSDGEWNRIASSKVWKISGGQVQRLGLARAFGHGQDLVFLDEPTNNLDVRNREGVAEFVQAERSDRALVVVSHDDDFLGKLGIDRKFHIEQQPDNAGGIRRVLTEAEVSSADSELNTAQGGILS